MEAKTDLSTHRVGGKVPAATLAETGSLDIIVFGPWGAAGLVEAFEYSPPPTRSIAKGVSAALISYAGSR